ncbi:ribosome biogenesis GTPase YlqF [Fusibacter ferrireducens]|uniref:Ribosome biogenesis GTPase A n=1 Tax=Fusibacter ferrireducens TaxID=2785058 RepID=A0ABR9ZP55_9FIRM|nr:ribosome biogenesis GTPase YlqF [Fusibacter ferrireducens]MBF4691710.1 ribosome biogenesis GTPase YlqF [Fusibacter ferrireducens]
MSINWYPGHMKKTKDLIQNNLKLIDVAIELMDARIPISSRNPQFDTLLKGKKRVIALNKSDLADPQKTRLWVEYFAKQGIKAIPIDSLGGQGVSQLVNEIKIECKDQTDKALNQGRLARPIRVMIIGIPNVGKSSLINKLAGKSAAVTGNKPGVTRGKQWIRINKEIELFDTPGILWPKIEEDSQGIKLACSGAIKDQILNIEDIAFHLIQMLMLQYPDLLRTRYKFEHESEAVEIMEWIGRKRGCLLKKNEVDYEKVARIVLDEFRKGIIGKISLELPEDTVECEA